MKTSMMNDKSLCGLFDAEGNSGYSLPLGCYLYGNKKFEESIEQALKLKRSFEEDLEI